MGDPRPLRWLVIALALVVSVADGWTQETDRAPAQKRPDGSLVGQLGDSALELGTYHTLLIGINDYQHTDFAPRLRTAVGDVQALARLLIDDYGFKNVKLLLDRHASRAGILKALAEFRDLPLARPTTCSSTTPGTATSARTPRTASGSRPTPRRRVHLDLRRRHPADSEKRQGQAHPARVGQLLLGHALARAGESADERSLPARGLSQGLLPGHHVGRAGAGRRRRSRRALALRLQLRWLPAAADAAVRDGRPAL